MSGYSSCKCKTCVKACRFYPGWMTPEDADKAIKAGLGHRLMVDWWDESDGLPYIEILIPGAGGNDGRMAPEINGGLLGLFFQGFGSCTFLKNDLCEIHDSGFKPLMCRESLPHLGKNARRQIGKLEIAKLWNTDAAREIVANWKAQHLQKEAA